ncbi:MAG: tetratricopeptide repeat protein [Lishizhenia sp.]
MIRICICITLLSLFVVSCGEKKKTELNQFTEKKVVVKSLDEDLAKVNQSLSENENNVALLIQKAKLCRDSYDFGCTLESAAKAYRLDSTNVEARDLYAWTLINKSTRTTADIENAQRHFKYIIEKKPRNVAAYVNLANTYSLLGNFKKSFQYINEGLRIDKNFRDAYVLKGSNYRIIGDTALTISSFETAIQVDPTNIETYLNVADYYVEIKNPIALEYYQTAYDLKPVKKDFLMRALYGVAKTQQDLGRFQEALEGYRELIAVDSLFYIANFNSGFIKQFRQMELDSAVYYYNLALAVNPEFVQGWHNLGLAYIDQNRKSDAARAFSNVVRIAPDYEPIKEALELLK